MWGIPCTSSRMWGLGCVMERVITVPFRQPSLTKVKGRKFPFSGLDISCWELTLGMAPGRCGPEQGGWGRCLGQHFTPSLYFPLCFKTSIQSQGQDWMSHTDNTSFRSFELGGL